MPKDINTSEKDAAARALISTVVARMAERDDFVGFEALLEHFGCNELAIAVQAVAERLAGLDLEDLANHCATLNREIDEHDARGDAKLALVRLGMSPFEAERAVLDAERKVEPLDHAEASS